MSTSLKSTVISIGGEIERRIKERSFAVAPPIEIIANSLQISNIVLIFTKRYHM